MGKKNKDNQKPVSERAVDPFSRQILSASEGRKETIDQTNFLVYLLDPLGFSLLIIATCLPAIAVLLLFGVVVFIITISFLLALNTIIIFLAKKEKTEADEKELMTLFSKTCPCQDNDKSDY